MNYYERLKETAECSARAGATPLGQVEHIVLDALRWVWSGQCRTAVDRGDLASAVAIVVFESIAAALEQSEKEQADDSAE